MSSPLSMPDMGTIAKKVVGFLEEAPGVKSSTRLFAAILLGLAAALVLLIDWYIWYCVTRTPPRVPDSSVISAVVAGLTVVVAQGAVAIVRRSTVDHPNGGDS